jgi:hypothetical protein
MSIVGNIRNFGKYNAVGNYPIELTKYGNKSRMFGEFSRSFIEMLGNPDEGGGTLNNHHHGLSPEEFSNNYRLRGFLKINAIGQDINKKQFVAAIEARYWPIYGVQWHPERQGDLGQPFVEFFISELSKNKHICQTIPVSISSKKKPRPCIQYPELTDQLCYFFKE